MCFFFGQVRFYCGPCCSKEERELTTGFLACSGTAGVGRAGSLYGVRVGLCPGVGPEGRLRCFAHPSGGVECRVHAQYLAFAPCTQFLLLALQKWQLGFFCLLYLLSRICPTWSCTQLFLVPYSFFVFCCWRRGVSRCKHSSKGSQVTTCLIPPERFYTLILKG